MTTSSIGHKTTIQGLTFYDSPASCISAFKKESWTVKAKSFIQSCGTGFVYSLNKIANTFRLRQPQIDPRTKAPSGGFSENKLIVCLHGLNSRPERFKKIVLEMEKRDLSNTAIYVPYILQKGHAKLDDMVKPILDEIAKWAKTSGEKELVLVGISNGGRIARAIEAELLKPENRGNVKTLRFVSIVGACKGSALANLAHRLHLSRFMSKYIAKEMPTNSKRMAQLDRDLKNAPFYFDLTRDYTFIASPHDGMVPNFNSTLLDVTPFNARYAIVPGHGHNSAAGAAAAVIAEIATDIKRLQN